MNQIFSILSIVLIIVGIYLLSTDLYTIYCQGKLIVKVKESKGLSIFWVVALIFWVVMTWFEISEYIDYKNSRVINNIIVNIFWIEFSVSNIIRSVKSLEIRENGIYNSGYFYKWSKIKNYSWISENVIQFKINTLFKANRSCEFAIKEEVKLKVNEVMQRNFEL